ncbi:MAG: DUF1467 family protein [Rhodobacteraceae bacterium]|nr:DUF1467 family protein [Paracoccaceae bacterium]
MGITSALVLYAVIWFMTWLIILPLRIQTQGDMGEIVPGTHVGSPEVHHLKKKAWVTTGVAAVLWIIIVGVILYGVVEVRDFDWFNRLPPITD